MGEKAGGGEPWAFVSGLGEDVLDGPFCIRREPGDICYAENCSNKARLCMVVLLVFFPRNLSLNHDDVHGSAAPGRHLQPAVS